MSEAATDTSCLGDTSTYSTSSRRARMKLPALRDGDAIVDRWLAVVASWTLAWAMVYLSSSQAER